MTNTLLLHFTLSLILSFSRTSTPPPTLRPRRVNRLAEVAFEAQDEVATLRKKLEEHQHSSSAASSSTVTTAEHDTTTKGADDGDNVEVLTVADSLARGNGDPTQAAAGSASEVSPGGSSDARVIQLELEKRKCEEQREAAEREAQQAKLELEKTQAKVINWSDDRDWSIFMPRSTGGLGDTP